jgi:membrane associated rhomboid family serine protease
MGYDQRKYMRQGGDWQPSRLAGAPVVKYLLGLNIAAFLLDQMGRSKLAESAIWQWGSFNIGEGIFGLQLWRFISFQFLHADFFHLLFNMIGLYFFGPFIERWWQSRRFAAFYLLCGASGAVCYFLLSRIPGLLATSDATTLVGASAGIFGILIAMAVVAPDVRVMLLFPPIEMKMRTLAMVFIGIAVFRILAGGGNAGGEAGHLGGVVAGFLLMKFPGLLDVFDRSGRAEVVRKRPARRGEAKLRPRSGYVAGRETEVDAILDKINREGFGSLNEKEKEILRRAADEGQMG